MAVSFNTIPTGRLTPFTFIEFSNRVRAGASNAQVYKALIFGQKESTGTAKENEYISGSSLAEAGVLFGVNSSIYRSYKIFKDNNNDTPVVLCSQSEPAGAKSTKKEYTFTGTATSSGNVGIVNRSVEHYVNVEIGDTAVAVTAKIANLIIKGITIKDAAGTLTFESTTKGVLSDFSHDIKINVQGISFTTGAGITGSGVVNLDDALKDIPNESFNIIISNYNDDANIAKFKKLLEDRWGAEKQLDGILFVHNAGSVADIIKLKPANKSKYIVNVACTLPNELSAYEYASAYASVVAKYAQIDPARPFQTLEILGIVPHDIVETISALDRELLLKNGFSTYVTNKFGEVLIERVVTSYLKDNAYRDLNTLLVLSFLRYDFRTTIQQKFPRHKLANDSERFSGNQPIVTPLIARAEAMSIFNSWETQGLIQNVELLKESLVVEIDSKNSSRLNMSLPVDLVNQLRITAIQVNFSV